MKKFFTLCLLASSVLFAESSSKIIKKEKFSDSEKQHMVDKNLKKFAKQKHKAIIQVEEKDVDDYMGDRQSIQDPLEKMNRAIHFFNGALDFIIFEPLAYMYRDALPSFVQKGVSNVTFNIASPLYAVNHLLQADMDNFFKTTGAFIVNTVFGGLGLFDMAEGMGLKRTSSSFDKTLASWGMESGPYLVLPLFGSSSFRGALGVGGDMFLDPISILASNKNRSHNKHGQQKNIYLAVWGISIIEKRAEIIPFVEDIKKSIDPYVAVRSAYDQRRMAMEKSVS